jgi:hypothetical protein
MQGCLKLQAKSFTCTCLCTEVVPCGLLYIAAEQGVRLVATGAQVDAGSLQVQ